MKRSPALAGAALCVLLALSALLPGAARGQEGSLAEAARLRDAREFPAAVELLREHLARHPADAGALRMLAQTLYWMGDVRGARARYEEALEIAPGDESLRLEYARMLVESWEGGRAREVLRPLPAEGPAAAEAEALLGTLAYWHGDLTGASRRFRRALALRPGHEEAARQLAEIRALSAPWVRLAAGGRTDDQPLERRALAAEAGWHLTPLRALVVRVEPQRYEAGGAETLLAAEAELRDYWPALRLEVEAAGGILRRSTGDDWTGRAALGLRLPRRAVLRGSVERRPYLWTTASLGEPVVTTSAAGALAWDDPAGWLGEAGGSVRRFPDGNVVTSVHAWLLAPLLRGGGAELRAGYGASLEDARESRFVPLPPRAGLPREGRYVPYYTPEQVRIHSAIGALLLPLGGGVSLSAGGSYGFHATEWAPAVDTASGSSTRPGGSEPLTFALRSFHPWSARGGVSAPLGRRVLLTLRGEHARTAFYRVTTLGASVAYRFVPGGAR